MRPPTKPKTKDDDPTWSDLVPEWVKDLKPVADALITLVRNPRRFVLGVILSTLVTYVITALTLGVHLTQWLAGFQVPGQITVDGNAVDIPWCNATTCDLFSLVDIPGYIGYVTIESFSPGGLQFLQGIASIWGQIPSDGGLAGPVVLFLGGLAAVLGVYWLIRVVIGLSPISLP